MDVRYWLLLGLLTGPCHAKPCCPKSNLFSLKEEQCDEFPEAQLPLNCSSSFFMLDPNLIKEDAFTINAVTGVLQTSSDPPMLLQPEE